MRIRKKQATYTGYNNHNNDHDHDHDHDHHHLHHHHHHQIHQSDYHCLRTRGPCRQGACFHWCFHVREKKDWNFVGLPTSLHAGVNHLKTGYWNIKEQVTEWRLMADGDPDKHVMWQCTQASIYTFCSHIMFIMGFSVDLMLLNR